MTIHPATVDNTPPSAPTHHLPLNSSLPPYRQVANKIRAQIRSGALRAGDRLPSTRSLQDTYGIANSTAQAVMRLLRQEGLACTTPGRGSFVADQLPPAGMVPHPTDEDAAPTHMPTAEYVELSRRLDELAASQDALLRRLRQVGELGSS
ncbi:GntR family transcriptional regulator [Streptomyces sp. NPDC090442]|uniref:GntR family transcriptional regulator n=1 Tax=Streptomyces sp. NPDC090442 TaxID=3365962 RepID=UPI003813DB7D